MRIDNDSMLKQAVNVTFLIDRKHKVKIGKITFSGNEQFSDRRLRKTFKKTHQKSINIFRGAKLNENDYEDDKELLIDFYNSKGYRNANILSDSVFPINDRRLGIHIDLSEGDKYYIRKEYAEVSNLDAVGDTSKEGDNGDHTGRQFTDECGNS